MSPEIAAKLYILSQQKNNDPVGIILEIICIVQNQNIEDILDIYQKIKEGNFIIAKVFTAKRLSEISKKVLEKNIKQKFGANVITVYYRNPKILGGYKIYLNDELIDESYAGKIENLYKI